mmetsp:Transcript_10184/g.5262  ORF Transcript_10184/g.5262 Transcript_10184/m.5262 type:complete len:133 (+) Transcript_10184:143-541(+)
MKHCTPIFFIFIILFLPINNSIAKGICIEGDCVNGQGSMNWPDGSKYVGEWQEGDEHGQGTLTYPKGSKYVGEWKGGKKHGQGTLTFPNGAKYVGEYIDGLPNRQGTFIQPDGWKYVGCKITLPRKSTSNHQ